MKFSARLAILILGIASISLLFSCEKKEDPKLNIVLHNKSLGVIQSNVQGKWKLQKVTGGICDGCYPAVSHNPYLIIPDHQIVMGNDSGGTLDTVIVWKWDRDIFNDSTYLLSYRDIKTYNLPIYKVVDQIRDDQLILTDNAYDAFYYYYSK